MTALALAWHPTFPDILAVSLDSGSVELVKANTSSAGKEDSVFLRVVAAQVLRHDFHAWTVAFAAAVGKHPDDDGDDDRDHDDTVRELFLVSGGDDVTLRISSLSSSSFLDPAPQSPSPSPSPSASASALRQPVPQRPIRRAHQAGVTAVLPLPLSSNSGATEENGNNDEVLVLTGSFDEHVRLLDIRTGNVHAERRLDDGVWRLKMMADNSNSNNKIAIAGPPTPSSLTPASNTVSTAVAATTPRPGTKSPERSLLVLACCMSSGARVLRVTQHVKQGPWSIVVVGHFTEHQSLTYGCGVQPSRTIPAAATSSSAVTRDVVGEAERMGAVTGGRRYRCVTVSFYDRRVCVWDFEEAERP